MRVKILVFAFSTALLMALGMFLLDDIGTAEAAIHPIVQSECAARDSNSDRSGSGGGVGDMEPGGGQVEIGGGGTAGNLQDPPGQVPGHSHSSASNFAALNHSADEAKSGEGAKHCKNVPPGYTEG